MEDSSTPEKKTGYLDVVSPDEQEFIDKHVVNKLKDRNGNDDEVFKASNVKRALRKPTRHGYEPGEDAKVYEEKEPKPQWGSAERKYALKRKETLDNAKKNKTIEEEKMTPAQLKKREEIAKAIAKKNPDMPMGKKMAIATAAALKEDNILKPAGGRFGLNKPSKSSDGLSVKDKTSGDSIHIGLDKPYKATVTSPSGTKKTFTSSSDLKSHLLQKTKPTVTETVIDRYSRSAIIDRIAEKFIPSVELKSDEDRFNERIEHVAPIYKTALLETFDNLSDRNKNVMLEKAETQEGIRELVDFIIKSKRDV